MGDTGPVRQCYDVLPIDARPSGAARRDLTLADERPGHEQSTPGVRTDRLDTDHGGGRPTRPRT